MAKISYVNGRYVHHRDAFIHVEDRGYQFADGVYEVIAFYNRRFVDEALHMKRIARSMGELGIAPPMHEVSMRMVMREVVARNDRMDGTLYMQVTRGVAKRDHIIPANLASSLTMVVNGARMPKESDVRDGIAVATVKDIRWGRRDIKSVSLLPNTLAKQQAMKAGAREAWLVGENGMVTEASAANSAIVNSKSEIITHPANDAILGGCTRNIVIGQAKKAGYTVVERPFSVEEAKAASEAFITGTTANVLPVTSIDGVKIGTGRPGQVTLVLLKLYHEHIFQETGKPWN